jgi:RNA polymerase sigma factor (sigma-70 family)
MFPSPSADTQVALRKIFDLGTLSGLTEGQLLERYLTSRDERAFEILVTRHAGMVLGVCRRMLMDSNDVDDAFQATFLILVRRASTIRSRDRLSPWLYGVAYKVASRARAVSKARKARERTNLEFDLPDRPSADSGSEFFPLFDEELTRLPEKYRAPVRLCCLEGKSHDEAAAELAWPVGTVRSRLFRGRRLLQERLTRRGVAPSLIAGQSLEALVGPTSALEPSLVQATLQTVSRFQNAKLVAGATASSVAVLTQGVLTTMFLTKLKIAAGSLVVLSAVGSGTVLLAQDRDPKPQPHQPPPLSRSNPQDANGRRPVAEGGADAQAVLADPVRAVSAHELRVRLNAAIRKQALAVQLSQRGQMAREEMNQINDDVEILKAQIDDEREALTNAIEILQIRLSRMETELLGLQAELAANVNVLGQRRNLVDQKVISPSELGLVEVQVEGRRTQLALKKIDIREIQARINQLNRKLKLFEPDPTQPGRPAQPQNEPSPTPNATLRP